MTPCPPALTSLTFANSGQPCRPICHLCPLVCVLPVIPICDLFTTQAALCGCSWLSVWTDCCMLVLLSACSLVTSGGSLSPSPPLSLSLSLPLSLSFPPLCIPWCLQSQYTVPYPPTLTSLTFDCSGRPCRPIVGPTWITLLISPQGSL